MIKQDFPYLPFLSSSHVSNISLLNFVFIRKNPKLAFGISLSAMNMNRFVTFVCEEENSPAFAEKDCWHLLDLLNFHGIAIAIAL